MDGKLGACPSPKIRERQHVNYENVNPMPLQRGKPKPHTHHESPDAQSKTVYTLLSGGGGGGQDLYGFTSIR